MSEAPRYVTLRDYLRVLREHRLMIVLTALVFAAVAFVFSLQQEEVYEAEASLSIDDPSEGAAFFGQEGVFPEPAEQRAAELAGTAVQAPTLRAVAQRLEGELRPAEIASRITTRTETSTNFVVIEAAADDPRLAARLANFTAAKVADSRNAEARQRFAHAARLQRSEVRALAGQRDQSPTERLTQLQIERQVSSLQALSRFAEPVQVARSAAVPAAPSSPYPVRNTLLGLLVGLTLGVIAAFVRDSLDRRLRSSSEIEREMSLPLVGQVSAETLDRTVGPSNGRSTLTAAELEAFRILRMNVSLLDRAPRTIAVTSALPEEGKSTVAAALAFASALAGSRVALVECDLRRPSMAGSLGISRSPGLTECLSQGSDPRSFLQRVTTQLPREATPSAPSTGANGGPIAKDPAAGLTATATASFDCLTAGEPIPRPAEALESKRFRELLSRLADEYDAVVVDTSPLLTVVDTLALIPQLDGVLLCVRKSRTTRDQLAAARRTLEHLPARPTGIVVTGLEPGEETYYGHYAYAERRQ